MRQARLKNITISGKWLRTTWHRCATTFIDESCAGRCCQGGRGKVLVAVLPEEQNTLQQIGADVVDGMLQADSRNLCPFKLDDGRCQLHATENKPFGCQSAPFILNKNGTLVIRHRYIHMPCYGGDVPAHMAFMRELRFLLGDGEARAVRNAAIGGEDKLAARMPYQNYIALMRLHGVRHG